MSQRLQTIRRSWILRRIESRPCQLLFLLLLLLALGGVTNLLRGQGNWWDILNYHIDNPWNLLHHRWRTDLFASGIQGYFHPALDVPYYMLSMVWLPDHPRIVAFLAGLPFGFLLFVVYLIASRVLKVIEPLGWLEYRFAKVLVVLVSVTGVSAWTQVGQITNEIAVSTLVLCGVYLFVTTLDNAVKLPGHWKLLAIGGLLGLAAGFKLTAVIYAPALGIVILATSPNLKSAIRSGSLYTFGWFIIFALVYGPWAWHLYELTGNPMFPGFNNIFHSDFSRPVGGRDVNSMPENALEWLFYPFFWLNSTQPSVYNRLPFRDPRVMLFYLTAVTCFVSYVYCVVRRKKQAVPRVLRCLVLFGAVSYAVWLVMFSMLRYAIVIEVISGLTTAVAFCWIVTRMRVGRWAILKLSVLAVFVAGVMTVTVYPSVPRVAYGSTVFAADTPVLKKNALVILANQPMGILAPLIQRTNQTVTFVGIPGCFRVEHWCYSGFYDYGLGHEIRKKVADHAGPLYVVYYLNEMPVMPQLALFRVAVDFDHCQQMTTNVTPNIAICRARYIDPGHPLPAARNIKNQLAVQVSYFTSGTHIRTKWRVNPCASKASAGELWFGWNMPDATGGVRIYLNVPPENHRIPFAGGGSSGTAVTGRWVRAQQIFVFVAQSGKVLAKARTHYIPCDSR